MQKKIIRTQQVWAINSQIILTHTNETHLDKLCQKFGLDWVLREVFKEKTNSYQQLQEEYRKFLEGGESSLFATMYVLNPSFGVVIDEHIYLYHCFADTIRMQEEVLPWIYMESKKYLGDTWWFEPEEIINDLHEMTIYDFLEKYRGY